MGEENVGSMKIINWEFLIYPQECFIIDDKIKMPWRVWDGYILITEGWVIDLPDDDILLADLCQQTLTEVMKQWDIEPLNIKNHYKP